MAHVTPPGPAMDYLHPPVPTILIYPSHPTNPFLPLFSFLFFFQVDPSRTEAGGRERVVFQWRRAGQPAFIRMNQWGDKISPVTKQGYEIRVLIEFSSPGQGCGALNIIEFDRLMKRAPMLVPLAFNGAQKKPSTSHRMLMCSTRVSAKAHTGGRFFAVFFVCFS